MPTSQFERSYKIAQKRNKSLSYEEKIKIWSHCNRDWGNGTNKRQPYIPFEAAEAIHQSKARFLIIAAGNRFAKSLIAAMEAVAMMTVPGTRIWIIGPSYGVCGPEWMHIEYALTKTDVWRKVICSKIKRQLTRIGAKWKQKEKNFDYASSFAAKYRRVLHQRPYSLEINWPDAPSSIVEQKSYGADWSGLEGFPVSMIIFSEGSRVPKSLWDRHLKKRLSDNYGRVIIPSTPKGRDSFLYPSFKMGQSKELIVDIDWNQKKVEHYYKKVPLHKNHVEMARTYSESYETFQCPAFYNPYYNVDDYKSDESELFDGRLNESLFRERNYGTFESLSGNYYMGIDEQTTFVKSFPLPENVTCYRTIDPGRAGKACCLWVAVQPWEKDKFRYIVYKELYMDGLWVEKLVELVRNMTTEDIYYTVADREIARHKFDSRKSVMQRMIDLGIHPLKVPAQLPPTTIERYNYWLPDIKDGRVTIFDDQCPNFKREILELEYAEPNLTKTGHAVKEEKLAKSDCHAIDAFTYLRWLKPRYHSPEELERAAREKVRNRKEDIPNMSIAAALKERESFGKLGMLELLVE